MLRVFSYTYSKQLNEENCATHGKRQSSLLQLKASEFVNGFRAQLKRSIFSIFFKSQFSRSLGEQLKLHSNSQLAFKCIRACAHAIHHTFSEIESLQIISKSPYCRCLSRLLVTTMVTGKKEKHICMKNLQKWLWSVSSVLSYCEWYNFKYPWHFEYRVHQLCRFSTRPIRNYFKVTLKITSDTLCRSCSLLFFSAYQPVHSIFWMFRLPSED